MLSFSSVKIISRSSQANNRERYESLFKSCVYGLIPVQLRQYFTSSRHVQAPEGAGVIFENVRIFNGASDQLSTPSNALVAGNVIQSISAEAIAD